MCEMCEKESPDFFGGTQRYKLWEIDPRLHCSIIGTCLTMKELYRMVRKLKLSVPAGCPDYSLHGFFVKASKGDGENKLVSRQIQKVLERKFSTQINKVKSLKDDDLLHQYWRESVEAGSIPGPMWAIWTSPHASSDLKDEIFGEVHMLSHLEGASNRKALSQLQSQEKRLTQLEAQLARERLRHREQMAEKQVEIEQLSTQARKLAKTTSALEEAKERIRRAETQSHSEAQRLLIEELQHHLSDSDQRLSALSRTNTEYQRNITNLQTANKNLKSQNEEFLSQCQALEKTLMGLQAPACENSDCPIAETGDINLCGRCVVFVGGRSTQAPHFRALVERYNGRFVHHDGGLDDGQVRLEGALSKADVVFFPIDCVSHNATRDIKRHCKQLMKPFVPLPTAGLASFTKGLHETAPLFANNNVENEQ